MRRNTRSSALLKPTSLFPKYKQIKNETGNGGIVTEEMAGWERRNGIQLNMNESYTMR